MLFLSNPRKAPGHFLVSPKRHVEKPWELSQDELSAIFDLVFMAQQKIVEKLGGGCQVRQNYSPYTKQNNLKIDHVHYHVLPRSYKDRIYQISEKHDTELFEDLSEAEATEAAKILD